MSFAKVRMGREEMFTILVEDMDGRRIERWKVLKRDFGKVIKILNNKFGLGMVIHEKKIDRDLDWIK